MRKGLVRGTPRKVLPLFRKQLYQTGGIFMCDMVVSGLDGSLPSSPIFAAQCKHAFLVYRISHEPAP